MVEGARDRRRRSRVLVEEGVNPRIAFGDGVDERRAIARNGESDVARPQLDDGIHPLDRQFRGVALEPPPEELMLGEAAGERRTSVELRAVPGERARTTARVFSASQIATFAPDSASESAAPSPPKPAPMTTASNTIRLARSESRCC